MKTLPIENMLYMLYNPGGLPWRVWVSVTFAALFLCAGGVGAQGIFSIHSFDGADGSTPEAPLTVGTDGFLYGTTPGGGDFGDGTIFRMSPGGAMEVLHSFQDTDNDGAFQYSGVALGPDGNFYGTTYYGGVNGNGSIFQITPGGSYSTIHSFSVTDAQNNYENLDGAVPYAGLVYDATTGEFYGTTTQGGAYGYGTVFSVTTGGSLSTMYSFSNGVVVTSPDGDGNSPEAVLAIGPDGALYGTTNGGGTYEAGTAFRITTGSAFSTIHVFTQGLDGGAPSGLTLGPDNNFYGTAENGGQYDDGCVIQMTTAGTVNTLYSFTNGDDGGFPEGGVIFGPGGALYGTTSDEGTGGNAAGTVFSISPSGGALATLYTFGNVWGNGAYPDPTLVGLPNGSGGMTLYGVTFYGGADNYGTLFAVSPTATSLAKPFPGVYVGLLVDGGSYITISLSASGKFTGKVIIAGVSYPFKGRFSSMGAWQGTVYGNLISLQLGGQGAAAGGYFITGLVSQTALTAWHTAYSRAAAAPETGAYTLQLTPYTSGATIPQSPGTATLKVSATGSIHLAGKLPGGTSFSALATIVGDADSGDQCIIYSIIDYKDASPRGARGYLIGSITFPSGVATGALLWIKPAQTKGPYPAAINTDVNISP